MHHLPIYVLLLCISIAHVFCLTRVARWCTTGEAEQRKCEDLIQAVKARVHAEREYPKKWTHYEQLPALECVKGMDQFDCMEKISKDLADLIQLDPGIGYTGGQYFNLMPLMAESYSTEAGEDGLTSKAVAVVRTRNRDITIDTLRGKKACHTGAGQAAGWVYPISTLLESGKMNITECNVAVKSAAAFFSKMCVPDALTRYYNPFGNNPASICDMCQGVYGDFCTVNDPLAGYTGAFKCMADGIGDVAFVRDSTITEAMNYVDYDNTTNWQLEDFQLLCLDGRRAPVTDVANCNWGTVSSHVVMTSELRGFTFRDDYKQLLQQLNYDFGDKGASIDLFELYSSVPYGKPNLLFSDECKRLEDVGARDSYFSWAGNEHRLRLQVMNMCPEAQARWCVISRQEMSKCEDMIMAFSAKNLKPDLNCIMGASVRDCMEKIRVGDADLITLDAADLYAAGKYYNLVPIASEDYSGYDLSTYYAVAVSRKTESYMTLFNLKARRSCHSGVMTAAGWVIPVDKLIETGQINVRDSNAYKHVGQFFSKSCVPGLLEDAYNSLGTNPVNLCEACASGGQDKCMRNDEELYYGNSGAFRCLTERGGDVAFVKHTTVRENTNGRNAALWARNRRSDDYELLCNDGTRSDIDSWQTCNLGEIPANAIVTASFKSPEVRAIYWTLLNYAQKFFASDSNTDFEMFSSQLDHKDLIFQDSAVRLVPLPADKQHYEAYLGSAFMRAMERMQEIDSITATGGVAGRVGSPVVWCMFVCALFVGVIW